MAAALFAVAAPAHYRARSSDQAGALQLLQGGRADSWFCCASVAAADAGRARVLGREQGRWRSLLMWIMVVAA